MGAVLCITANLGADWRVWVILCRKPSEPQPVLWPKWSGSGRKSNLLVHRNWRPDGPLIASDTPPDVRALPRVARGSRPCTDRERKGSAYGNGIRGAGWWG